MGFGTVPEQEMPEEFIIQPQPYGSYREDQVQGLVFLKSVQFLWYDDEDE